MAWWKAVASIASAFIGSRSNSRAADTANRGLEAQAAAIREGDRLAQGRFETLIEQGQPGVNRLRQVVGRPASELTPAQKIGLEDVQRGVRTRLSTGGLRGSGRAGAAVFNDAVTRFTADSIARNESRGDTAARTLAGSANSATTEAARGSASTGRALGRNAAEVGELGAGAEVANGRLFGDTIGTLSSIFARNTDGARDQRTRSRENV